MIGVGWLGVRWGALGSSVILLRAHHMHKNTAVYPGTFDPVTYGHIDLVERASHLFEAIIIAVSAGAGKTPAFSLEQRLALTAQVFAHNPRVKVAPFNGLLVDFMQTNNIQVVLRGLRTLADVQYEFQLATMNQLMKSGIETVFLKTADQYAHISSTIVREIAVKGGEQSLGDLALFVPPVVVEAFAKRKT